VRWDSVREWRLGRRDLQLGHSAHGAVHAVVTFAVALAACLRAPRWRAYLKAVQGGVTPQGAGALRAARRSGEPRRAAGGVHATAWGGWKETSVAPAGDVATVGAEWSRRREHGAAPQAGRGAAHADRSGGAVAGHDRLKRVENLSPREEGDIERNLRHAVVLRRAAGSSGGRRRRCATTTGWTVVKIPSGWTVFEIASTPGPL